MISTFGKTNVCEQTFSLVKYQKNKYYFQGFESSFINNNIQYESEYNINKFVKNIQPQKSLN